MSDKRTYGRVVPVPAVFLVYVVLLQTSKNNILCIDWLIMSHVAVVNIHTR